MNWDEIQAVVRARLRAQPRGYYRILGNRLERSRGQVAHWAGGQRNVPAELLPAVCSALGLELVVREVGTVSPLKVG